MQTVRSVDGLFKDEFDWAQVIQFTGPVTLKIDNTLFDLVGYQFFRKLRELDGSIIPFQRIEFSGAGTATLIVGHANELTGISQVPSGIIQGGAASGAAPAGAPVLVAGQDDTPLVRTLRTDTNGRLVLGTSKKVSYKGGYNGGALIVTSTGAPMAGIGHLAAATKRVEIYRMKLTWAVEITPPAPAQMVAPRLTRITGFTAFPGTVLAGINAPMKNDGADAAAEASLFVQSGTNTGFTGGTLQESDGWMRCNIINAYSVEWNFLLNSKPLILRPGVADSYYWDPVIITALTAIWPYQFE